MTVCARYGLPRVIFISEAKDPILLATIAVIGLGEKDGFFAGGQSHQFLK
jgi:hypothetical protein